MLENIFHIRNDKELENDNDSNEDKRNEGIKRSQSHRHSYHTNI